VILIDTDHLSVLSNRRSAAHASLVRRMTSSPDQEFAIPVICVEEQCKGWLALVNRARRIHDQVEPYGRLAKLIDFLSDWHLVPFDVAAADEFERLRKQRVRIGTQDLKIAATTVVNDALLLTANLRDFRQVPELRAEDWLHP
jgi:tRNA(fMet)-specific endonuclease VapC